MYPHNFSKSITQDIKKLYNYDNHHGILAGLYDYLIVIFAIALSEYSYYFFPITCLLIGSRQRALATLLHEAAHGTLAKNRQTNKILGTVFSGHLIFQGWDSYKRSHVINHHHHLGDLKYDPDFQYYVSSGIFKKTSSKVFIVKFLIQPMFFLNCLPNIKYLLTERLLKTKNKKEFISILSAHVGLFSLMTLSLGIEAYLIYWLIPYLTFFQSLTWFIELSEHYPMIAQAQSSLYATRNRFSGFIEHFLTGMHSENFHLVHHLFPGLPFWNLKKAHCILLGDPVYASLNARFGGIFTSSNYAPTLWSATFSCHDHKSLEI